MRRTATRLARILGRDKNPLRRRTDQLEAAIIPGLLAVFLIAAPILAVVAGRVTDDLQLRQQHSERAWRQVPATVLRSPDAVNPPGSPSGDWVPARWTTPGGQQREGRVAVASTVTVGQRVPVWVDGAGRLTAPPLAHGEILVNVALAVLLTPLGVAVVLVAAGWLTRQLIDRRRMAEWERAWRSVGPKWSRQRLAIAAVSPWPAPAARAHPGRGGHAARWAVFAAWPAPRWARPRAGYGTGV